LCALSLSSVLWELSQENFDESTHGESIVRKKSLGAARSFEATDLSCEQVPVWWVPQICAETPDVNSGRRLFPQRLNSLLKNSAETPQGLKPQQKRKALSQR